jgi:NAD(P)-dependent dehydrogenase (short-subunit alcohol dehydrogenase family)
MTRRVGLITGGSRGIGLAVARRLLDDGYAVCVTARKVEGLTDAAAALGNRDRLMTAVGRSDDPDHRRVTVDALIDRFGRFDVLINNAGINPVFGRLVDLEQRSAEKIMNVNLHAALGWVREMQRVMSGSRGAIVNISSYATVRPSPGLGMYGASKAALTHLTKQLALELAPKVRVNCVVPALIATEFAGRLYEGRHEDIEAGYPLGRLGRPEDVAAAVAFLSSAESGWITGESLLIDGGLSLTGGVA